MRAAIIGALGLALINAIIKNERGKMKIEIWQPRWHDRIVLVAVHKLKKNNTIIFTKAPSLPRKFKILGDDIKKYSITNNGKISCYELPLDVLLEKNNTELKK